MASRLLVADRACSVRLVARTGMHAQIALARTWGEREHVAGSVGVCVERDLERLTVVHALGVVVGAVDSADVVTRAERSHVLRPRRRTREVFPVPRADGRGGALPRAGRGGARRADAEQQYEGREYGHDQTRGSCHARQDSGVGSGHGVGSEGRARRAALSSHCSARSIARAGIQHREMDVSHRPQALQLSEGARFLGTLASRTYAP